MDIVTLQYTAAYQGVSCKRCEWLTVVNLELELWVYDSISVVFFVFTN